MLKIKQAGVYRWTLSMGVTVADRWADIGDRVLVKLVSGKWAWAKVVDAYLAIGTTTRMIQVRCAQRQTGYVGPGAQRRAEDMLKETRRNLHAVQARLDANPIGTADEIAEYALQLNDLDEARRANIAAKRDLQYILSQTRRTPFGGVRHG